MKTRSQIAAEIDARAKVVVKKYLSSEIELIDILGEADRYRVYTAFNHSSLYAYATEGLGLPDSVALTCINIARKGRKVPALLTAIRSGSVAVSKAKRICSVLRPDNHEHWLKAAATCSKRKLEKLVAGENPREAVTERAKYVSKDRLELQVGVSEKFMIRLRRAQDVMSQKKRRPVSLEETLEESVGVLLQKEDPLERAKRQMAKGKLVEAGAHGAKDAVPQDSRPGEIAFAQPPSELCPGTVSGTTKARVANQRLAAPTTVRRPLAAATRHKLTIKFDGQCGFVNRNGERCQQRRFLDAHHIQPVSEGGTDELSNLELLCSGHHRVRHE